MKRAIGIDIGGTKILGGIIDSGGTIIKSITIPSKAKQGRKGLLKNVFKVIDELNGSDIDGIGVCAPGFVNSRTGTIIYAAENMPEWSGCELKDILSELYSKPIIIENDANAAVIGEGWTGAARGLSSYVMLALGTGVGGAIVSDYKLIRGTNYTAGEFGHAVFYPDGKPCSCGKRGCLEQYVSGTALYNRYNELSGTASLKSAKDVFNQLEHKDEVAVEVIREFAKNLSIAIINIIHYIDPEVCIIGGGLIDAKHLWWDSLNEELHGACKITSAELGNNAAMIGSAKLLFEQIGD